MAELVYISDDAYEFLVLKAVDGEFVRAGTHRRGGMGYFLGQLSRIECYDTRPKYLRETDNFMIAANRTPYWSAGLHVKRARLLTIDNNAIERFCTTAVIHGIFIKKGFIGGPKPKSPISIAGAVIEAIGVEYLEPIYWPLNHKIKAGV